MCAGESLSANRRASVYQWTNDESRCYAQVSCVANTIKLFDKSSGELLSEYSGHTNREYRLDCCLDHTDKFVLSGSENGQVIILH